MTAFAVLLVALGLADSVSGGLSGTPSSYLRAFSGIAVASALAAAWAWAIPSQAVHSGAWLALVLIACCGWILPRVGRRPAVWKGSVALTVLGTAIAIGLFHAGFPTGESRELAHAWSGESPFRIIASRSSSELALGLGVLLFLSATSNGVVRTVLAVAGTRVTGAEKRLRAGRFIGVIERYLIFGLAVAGQPTAAALVVSAKSILRFPELSRKAREDEVGRGGASPDGHASEVVVDVDVITEYFLLGSLTSWLLALAPVVLFL